jgi:serine/threonine protein kinase
MRSWEPNQKLKNGRFTIQKRLGGGGFGVAYSAIENRTSKLLVIKSKNSVYRYIFFIITIRKYSKASFSRVNI